MPVERIQPARRIITRAIKRGTLAAMVILADHAVADGGFRAPTPFCAQNGRLEDYLARSGFTADDKISFASGASLQRYRYLGDVLWVARWPDGKSCLLANGLLAPSYTSPH